MRQDELTKLENLEGELQDFKEAKNLKFKDVVSFCNAVLRFTKSMSFVNYGSAKENKEPRQDVPDDIKKRLEALKIGSADLIQSAKGYAKHTARVRKLNPKYSRGDNDGIIR